MKAKLTPGLLADCIAGVESGRLTVEDCVATNPGVAGELHSLLLLAAAVAAAPKVVPDQTFRLRGRRELIAAMSGSTPAREKGLLPRVWYWMFPAWGRLPQTLGRRKGMPAFIIAIIIAIASAAGSGAVYASRDALPGDALYQVKTTLEGLQNTMATTDEAKLRLHLDLARKRLAEIRMASHQGNQVAAGQAAEALAEELTRIDAHLNRAEASGKDVTAILAQVVADITSQQRALAAEENLPEQVKAVVAKTGGATEQWLEVVGSGIPRSAGEGGILGSNAVSRAVAMPDEVAIGAITAPTITTEISETIGISLTEVISDVATLATGDPNISGQSYNGLLANLDAAKAALDRGEDNVATQILGAFANQLNAFQRSGHISSENYDSLYNSYVELVGALGGTPRPGATEVPRANKNPAPQASPEPTATPEPTPASDEQDEVRGRADHPNNPSNRGGERKEPGQQPSVVPTPGVQPSVAASEHSNNKPAKH